VVDAEFINRRGGSLIGKGFVQGFAWKRKPVGCRKQRRSGERLKQSASFHERDCSIATNNAERDKKQKASSTEVAF
jgi:hypothetical protein